MHWLVESNCAINITSTKIPKHVPKGFPFVDFPEPETNHFRKTVNEGGHLNNKGSQCGFGSRVRVQGTYFPNLDSGTRFKRLPGDDHTARARTDVAEARTREREVPDKTHLKRAQTDFVKTFIYVCAFCCFRKLLPK